MQAIFGELFYQTTVGVGEVRGDVQIDDTALLAQCFEQSIEFPDSGIDLTASAVGRALAHWHYRDGDDFLRDEGVCLVQQVLVSIKTHHGRFFSAEIVDSAE